MKSKLCGRCKIEKSIDNFWRMRTGEERRNSFCKDCSKAKNNKWRQTKAYKQFIRNKNYKDLYGITVEDYERIKLSQADRCKICRREVSILFVDHNHKTGKVRGLLCRQCNTGIGMLQESKDVMLAAIQYLEET